MTKKIFSLQNLYIVINSSVTVDLTWWMKKLKLAKKLFKDDGVIFVSIDDNEQAYLKVLMDEIFGEENLVLI
ncbi:DNA methyltransferase [Mycoplasma sp. CSL10137]|uniref:DNA methyltransferase n=1 Tax=Mycoplasma sp. CSL10137 TaxID=2813824 RepID=UPI00280BCCAE|nr:DNA methyltransferase [Mycoplasma sp. CSL10137]